MRVGLRAARHPMWANRSGLSLSARRWPPSRQQLKPVPPSEHGGTRKRDGRLHRQGPVVGGRPSSARRRRRVRGRALRALLVVAGVLLGLYGYHLLRNDLHSSVQNAVASVVVAWTFLFAGIVAWARRPHNRMGILMTVVAYC